MSQSKGRFCKQDSDHGKRKPPIDIALDLFYKWNPTYHGAASGTSSKMTRPPAWYDMHLHEELTLKNVVVMSELANQLANIADVARKEHGPLPALNRNFPDEEFRINDAQYRESMKNEYAVTERFKSEAFRFCSVIAATLQYKLKFWRSLWYLDLNLTQRHARPDAVISIRPPPQKSLSSQDREDVDLLARYGFDGFISWEHKNICAGDQGVMEDIIEYGGRPFFWIRCAGPGSCARHFNKTAKIQHAFRTGHRAGPDCTIPLLNLDPPPAQQKKTNYKKKRTKAKAPHIIQQAWAQAVANDMTFFSFSSGNYEIIAIRHRETQTMFLSGLIEATRCPDYPKIHVGLYIAAYRDALTRARHLRDCESKGNSLPHLYTLDLDDDSQDLIFTGWSKELDPKVSQGLVDECLLDTLEIAPKVRLVAPKFSGTFLGPFEGKEVIGSRVQDIDRAKASSDSKNLLPRTSAISPRVRADLTESVALDYHNLHHHLARIYTFISWGLLDVALNNIDQCLSIWEECPRARFLRCAALYKAMRYQDCFAACKDALRRKSGDQRQVTDLLLKSRFKVNEDEEEDLKPKDRSLKPTDRSIGSFSSKFVPRSDVATVVLQEALADQVYDATLFHEPKNWRSSQKIVVKIQTLCDDSKSTLAHETEVYRDLRFHGIRMPKHYGLFSYEHHLRMYQRPIKVYFSIMEYGGMSLNKMISAKPGKGFAKAESLSQLKEFIDVAHKRNIVHNNISRSHILCSDKGSLWSFISWGQAGEPATQVVAKKRKLGVDGDQVPTRLVDTHVDLKHNSKISRDSESSQQGELFKANPFERDQATLQYAFEGHLDYQLIKRRYDEKQKQKQKQ